jgi:hypothetical protein
VQIDGGRSISASVIPGTETAGASELYPYSPGRQRKLGPYELLGCVSWVNIRPFTENVTLSATDVTLLKKIGLKDVRAG